MSKGEKTVGEGVVRDLDAYYRFVRGVAAIGHCFLVDKGGLGTVSIVELENILR